MPIDLLSRWLVPAAVERPAPAAGKLLDLSPVAVTVQDTDGAPQAGLPVYAFNNTTYAGYSATTNSSGIATLTLPDGNYRFRSDLNGTQFWSGSENHCTVPGCESATVVVTIPVTVTVLDTDGAPVSGLPVYAFNGTAYTGYSRTTSASGEAVFTLPEGSYRFRADRNGTQFWSGTANHCDIPGCTSAGVTVTIPLVVTVRSTGGTPQAGLPVYAFNDTTYTGYSRTTDASGEAVFTLPQGSYRFRSDRAGTQFWSGEANHCDVPGCLTAEVVVTLPITVTVLDTDGNPQAGLPVYAFDGDTYTGFSGTTDDLGDVPFTLPEGSYRFRADLLGMQFWSDEVNHCDVPGCENVSIEVTSPLVLTVLDTDGVPKEGLPVYAFDGDMYTGFNGVTNASGQATFVLPQGSYRFRADLNGTQFWSGEANHCDVPGCVAASVTVTFPVTVLVVDQAGTPYPDLPVYAFTGDTYTGFNGTSDAEGNVVFTLPIGDYRFRADLDGVQFWSGETTTCTIPGCTDDLVPIPGGTIETDVTITYTYDPLYRLTAADYSTGEFFHYTYDAVGNRLTQETEAGASTYTYDIANRLTSVDDVAYAWDANGNLLSDGASTYSYDPANRLRTVDQGDPSYSFTYDGLGNRVQQIAPDGTPYDYTLDLAAGLTQVLDDTVSTYLYGRARVGEEQPEGWQYHLGDALGSVRELANSTGTVGLAQSFEPFGSEMSSFGPASTAFSFTGEQLDGTGLVYMRARYLSTEAGRFATRDRWVGNTHSPMSFNAWLYALANPITHVDPSGLIASGPEADAAARIADRLMSQYDVEIERDWGYRIMVVGGRGRGVPVYACRWQGGDWELSDLGEVEEAIARIAREMGRTGFLSTLGASSIARWQLPGKPGFAPPHPTNYLLGDIVLTDYFFSSIPEYAVYSVIHEYGHVWDHRESHRLSRDLMLRLGTLSYRGHYGGRIPVWDPFLSDEIPPGAIPGCTMEDFARGVCEVPYAITYGNAPLLTGAGWEDWATSFATYIYPQYYRAVARTVLEKGGDREDYVREKINSVR